MTVGLSKRTERRIEALFSDADRATVVRHLEEDCADNIGWSDATPDGLERVRFAVLKLSAGDLEELISALVLAQTDWRDALVSAGFGYDPNAHVRWRP